jgi:KDO2-lipid IV(A) lauroyltransferase
VKYRFQHIVEYALLRGFASLISALPYRGALALAWLVAAFAHFVLRYRVTAARARLRQVFGDRFTEREIRGIAWRAWRNFFFSSVEMLRRRRMTLEWIGSITDWDAAYARMKEHVKSGEGGIVATAHMGSWEMAAVSCEKLGMRMVYLAARQKNPLIDKFWHDLRWSEGRNETVLRTTSGMRKVTGLMQQGSNFTILPDVRSRHAGVSVSFLGGTANIGSGMARFARNANVPIFPCICVRRGWARHAFTVHDRVRPDPAADKDHDIERMTREVIAIIDSAIQQHPDQWFWFNKRWILDPLE